MECMVCMTSFDSQDYRPLFLPCGHSVCENCVSDLSESKTSFLCPSCRREISSTEAKNLPVNFSLLEQTNQPSPAAPEEHKEAVTAVCASHASKKIKFHCSGCQQQFCSKCVVKHTGAGHQIEELSLVVDRKIDQLVLSSVSLNGDIIAMQQEFHSFEAENEQLLELKASVEKIYDDCIAAAVKEKEEILALLGLAIETNLLTKTAANTSISQQVQKSAELLESLRNARHTLTNIYEKNSVLEKATKELSELALLRPKCQIQQYKVKENNVPAQFLILEPFSRTFETEKGESKEEAKEVSKEEHKEELKSPHQIIEAKKESAAKASEVSKSSLQRAPNKTMKRGEVRWWYMTDSKTWAPYAPAQSKLVEAAYQNKDPIADLGRYTVDFSTLMQTNKATQKMRKVGREIS